VRWPAKSWTWLLLPAVLMVVATLLLGRFFCGWICPTGAIPALPVAAKRREVIGKAVFDKNHCLPMDQ